MEKKTLWTIAGGVIGVVIAAGMVAAGWMLYNKLNNSGGTRSVDYLAVQFGEGDYWSIIDADGKVVVSEEYDADWLSCVYDKTFWVCKDGKYQLYSIDKPKTPLIDDEFDMVTDFCADRAVVSREGHPIQIIDPSGNVVATMPKSVAQVNKFKECGYAEFKDQNGHWGWLNKDGQAVRVESHMKKEGNTEVPNFAFVEITDDGIVITSQNDSTFCLRKLNGKKTSKEMSKKHIWMFNSGDGLIACNSMKDDNYSVNIIDKEGNTVLRPRKATMAHSYIGGLCIILDEKERWGVIDKEGNDVIRTKYERLYNLGSGLFVALKTSKDKMGIINSNDETVIPFEFDDCKTRLLGRNFVLKDGDEWYIYGSDGKVVSRDGYHDACIRSCDDAVTFTDTEAIAAVFVDKIKETDPNVQPEALVARHLDTGLTDDYRWVNHIQFQEYVGDFSAQMRYTFNDYIARELTHDVVEDDGWFQTTRTVSDGLAWNRPALTAVSMEVYVGAVRVPAEKIVEAINKKLRNDGWKERTDGSGMLTSKLKNRNCTVYTHSYPPDNIRISISFD